jgi:hypothetical protein
MDAYRLAKITALLLTLAIVGFYHRKILMALCGSISAGSLILSLKLSSGLSERANSALSICGILFGLLTFVLWIRLLFQEQGKANHQQDH